MSIFNKPIDEVTIDDINELVSNGVGESRTLDYKLELHGNGDSGKKELLKDISAFANTVGGCLIYGIEEEGGLPKAIVGVEIADFDKFKLHYENLLRMGVDPAIRGVEFHRVSLNGDKYIVIIDVPKSISRPHAVTINNHFKFYSRNSSGTNPLEVEDLRKAFLASESTATRIRNFRNDRVGHIVESDTPIQLLDGPVLILHLIPTDAFEAGQRHVLKKSTCLNVTTFGEGDCGCFNFDGYIITEIRDTQYSAGTYTQIYHNGVVEAVDKYMLGAHSDEKSIEPYALEEEIIKKTYHYLGFLREIGVVCPIWLCLSIVGVKGYWFYFNHLSSRLKSPSGCNEIVIPEVQIEDYGVPVETTLKVVFDQLWNAFGHERSMSYDENGERA
jgi:hypothetical protein